MEDTAVNDPIAQIGKTIYVTISDFQGKKYVDVRKYFESEEGPAPTRKGIAFDLKSWKEFVEKISFIDEEVNKRIQQE